MLVFSCPKCGSKLQMSDDLGGKKVRCAACEAVVTAPNPAEAIQPEEAPVRGKASTGVRSGSRKSTERDDDDAAPRRSSGADTAATAAAAAGAGIGIAGILGIVIAGVGVLACCAVLGVGAALLLPAVQRVREAAGKAQTMNNMKQVVLAEHNYNDTFKRLASPKLQNPQNQPVELSWRVNLLPFIEQGPLFNRFNKTSAWDSPANRPLLSPMPMPFEDVLRDSDKKGTTDTRFQYFTGPGTPWPDATAKRTMPGDFPGGTSNTILFAESANPVPWSRPADMAIQPGQALPLPPDNFLAAFADGSVRPIDRRRAPDAVLRQYIDPTTNQHQPID